MNITFNEFVNMKYINRLIILLIFHHAILFSQNRLTGTVRDVTARTAIQDVNIILKNTGTGTTTDKRGLYNLTVPASALNDTVIFSHISYVLKSIPVSDCFKSPNIYLAKGIISLDPLEIGGIRKTPEIKKDVPQTLSILDADNYELKGFIDIGDMIRTDQSVQINDNLSGEKTISVRGGNPEETLILYNGIKLNNSFNHIFDLSLIDLEDVERIEIIKGSGSSIYGTGAFSGAVNIVPKHDLDYTVRFYQKMGTYNSGNWGLSFFKKAGPASFHISKMDNASRREFNIEPVDTEQNDNALENNNSSLNSTVIINPVSFHRFGFNPVFTGSMMIYENDYINHKYNEAVYKDNRIVFGNFTGSVFGLNNLYIQFSEHSLYEKQEFGFQGNQLQHEIDDKSQKYDFRKTFESSLIDVMVLFDLEESSFDLFLDYNDLYSGQNQYKFLKSRFGIGSITKLRVTRESESVNVSELHISLRKDRVNDYLPDPGQFSGNTFSWEETTKEWDAFTYTVSSFNRGKLTNGLVYDIFLNLGRNIRFPTIQQAISPPFETFINGENDTTGIHLFSDSDILYPEEVRSVELSGTFSGAIEGLQDISNFSTSFSIFRNVYDNKFWMTYPIGIPISFYDNILNASLTGFESNITVSLYNNYLDMNFALSKYFFSDPFSFPFKSDFKITSSITLKLNRVNLQLFGYYEDTQKGWVREPAGNISELVIPESRNIDIHVKLNNTFAQDFLKIAGNYPQLNISLSARNILTDRTQLYGLPFKDRRYYLTVSAQL